MFNGYLIKGGTTMKEKDGLFMKLHKCRELAEKMEGCEPENTLRQAEAMEVTEALHSVLINGIESVIDQHLEYIKNY